jgi:GT2 family glycosyltransferase
MRLIINDSKVVVVIPTLGKNHLRLASAVRSIRKFSTHKNIFVLVVDNSYEANLKIWEGVDEIFAPGVNLGWVGSLEYVRRKYDFDYLWSFQDDMAILNDVLSFLIADLNEDKTLGVSSPVLLRNGLIPARTRGGKFTDESRTSWENIPEIDVSPNQFSQKPDLCFVASSGALWRKSSLDDISGFNLNLYPLMHVDVDTCLRLISKQWNLRINQYAHIHHEINGSTKKILSYTLEHLNRQIVQKHLLGQDPEIVPVTSTLDADFLFEITRKSSYLFLEVADVASRRIKQLENSNTILRIEFEELKALREPD